METQFENDFNNTSPFRKHNNIIIFIYAYMYLHRTDINSVEK